MPKFDISVLDCGGRGGIHRSWTCVPHALRYLSFEPDFEEAVNMEAKSSEQHGSPPYLRELVVYPVALWSTEGKNELHLYSERDLSSFYKLDKESVYRFMRTQPKYEGGIWTACSTLDGIQHDELRPIDFISVDAQGATLDVLTGGEMCLRDNILGIRCEAELAPVYVNAPTIPEIMRFLQLKGFTMLRIETCGKGKAGISTDMNEFSVNSDDALPVWADLVFVSSRFVAHEGAAFTAADVPEILKVFLFALHNGAGYFGAALLKRNAELIRAHALEMVGVETTSRLALQLRHYLSLSRLNPFFDVAAQGLAGDVFDVGRVDPMIEKNCGKALEFLNQVYLG